MTRHWVRGKVGAVVDEVVPGPNPDVSDETKDLIKATKKMLENNSGNAVGKVLEESLKMMSNYG